MKKPKKDYDTERLNKEAIEIYQKALKKNDDKKQQV